MYMSKTRSAWVMEALHRDVFTTGAIGAILSTTVYHEMLLQRVTNDPYNYGSLGTHLDNGERAGKQLTIPLCLVQAIQRKARKQGLDMKSSQPLR